MCGWQPWPVCGAAMDHAVRALLRGVTDLRERMGAVQAGWLERLSRPRGDRHPPHPGTTTVDQTGTTNRRPAVWPTAPWATNPFTKKKSVCVCMFSVRVCTCVCVVYVCVKGACYFKWFASGFIPEGPEIESQWPDLAGRPLKQCVCVCVCVCVCHP